MAGSGIDAPNVRDILKTGIGEIHASCSAISRNAPTDAQVREHRFGLVGVDRRYTDIAHVRSLGSKLDDFDIKA